MKTVEELNINDYCFSITVYGVVHIYKVLDKVSYTPRFPDLYEVKLLNIKTNKESLLKLIKLLSENGTKRICFSGGEPLLQSKFLLEVCKLLKKENYPTEKIELIKKEEANCFFFFVAY